MTHTRWKKLGLAFFAALVALSLACAPNEGTPTPQATAAPTPQMTATPGPAATQGAATPTAIPVATSTPATGSRENIIIGVEYVLIDNQPQVAAQAELLSAAGFRAAKPIAEAHSWGAMQSGPSAAINFSKLDTYVREFQDAGFTETTLALKSHSDWASVEHSQLNSKNATPKPEYRDLYAAWVTAVVERYDSDGVDDMPGLRYPVRHYEIGSELSSYEPEPVGEYLAMLETAYAAAHAAYPDVSVAHAAFLVMDLLLNDPAPEELDGSATLPRDDTHNIADIRAILDRGDLFDVVNIHALAHPGEIEQLVRWLNLEMDARGYRKPIIISDTSPNPFISYGPGNVCGLFANLMGVMVYPATEADRCRTADYFKRVLGKDGETLAWLRGYVAGDMVKKTVIAAEQGIVLIDTSFTTDLPILDSPLGFAGAGNAGWGGMIKIATKERFASYFAMRQLIGHIDGYESIRRLDVDGPEGTRVYEVVVGGEKLWIGWHDPPRLVLPGDDVPETTVTLPTGAGTLVIERMVERVEDGEGKVETTRKDSSGGNELVTLTQRPVFVWVE
jgi:hypothetical protein